MPVPRWQQRHLVYLFASIPGGPGVRAALAVEGGDPSSAPRLLPCLCPGFPREQISRAGDSRSHEKTVADVSLLSNTL